MNALRRYSDVACPEDADLWRALIEKVTFGDFPLRPVLTVRHEFGLWMDITILAQDRERPELRLKVIRCAPLGPFMRPDAAIRYVFNEVLELVRHELAEWFLVDGVRILDPHANDRFGGRGGKM